MKVHLKFRRLLLQGRCWIQNNLSIIILIFSFVIFQFVSYAQTDWQKWGKKNISYQIQDNLLKRDFNFDSGNPVNLTLKSLADAYWFLISDVDGDNCAFRPTCSSFFLESVKETNIVQGTLMFFDRFTRDMDIFTRSGFYPGTPDNHLYDPPENYRLQPGLIKYIPPSVVVSKR